jgi:hypothetical protein
VLWLPLMIGVAATWDRRPALCAVLLGLACAMKQEPWFIVPFALVHWWRTSDRSAAFPTTIRLLGALAAAFLVPNLPFMLWHPAAWLAGVLSPLLSHAVPLGSGVIQLQTSGLITLPLIVYTGLSIAALVVCVVCYARWTETLRWLPFIAPAIVLFFSPRSLQNYFIYWPLVLGVYAAVSTMKVHYLRAVETAPATRRTAMLALVGIASLIGFISATAAAGERIALSVRHVGVDADTGFVNSITMEVTNATPNAQTLHFAISSPLNSLVFWEPERFDVEAHSTATVHLRAADLSEEVPTSNDVGFQVVAYAPQERIAAYTRSLSSEVPQIRRLRNGRLAAAVSKFQMLPARAPLAWNVEPQPFLDGRLQTIADGPFGTSLRFRVAAPAKAAWNVVQVSQALIVDGSCFTFWIKPLQSVAAFDVARHSFAVTFQDARGRHRYFVVDAHAGRITRLLHGKDEYYLMPGRIGAWNRYTIDVTQLDRFGPVRNGALTISVVDAVHRGYKGMAGGDFGGIIEH